MAVKKVPSESTKAYHKRYSDVYAKHKKASLERHCKAFPNDVQSAKKLAEFQKGNVPYLRRTPKTKGGWNRARFDKENPNSFESVLATLSRAEAKKFAESTKASGVSCHINVRESRPAKKGKVNANKT